MWLLVLGTVDSHGRVISRIKYKTVEQELTSVSGDVGVSMLLNVVNACGQILCTPDYCLLFLDSLILVSSQDYFL